MKQDGVTMLIHNHSMKIVFWQDTKMRNNDMKFIQNIIWKKGNQISIYDKDLSRGICTLSDP